MTAGETVNRGVSSHAHQGWLDELVSSLLPLPVQVSPCGWISTPLATSVSLFLKIRGSGMRACQELRAPKSRVAQGLQQLYLPRWTEISANVLILFKQEFSKKRFPQTEFFCASMPFCRINFWVCPRQLMNFTSLLATRATLYC